MTSVDGDTFKSALRMFASGVSVVTVSLDGHVHGMTASSFAPVSLDPPLVLVSLDKTSRTRAMLIDAKRFVVNILRDDQEAIAKSFSVSGRKDFSTIPHENDDSGAAMFDEAIASLSCRTTDVVDAGDHDVFIGEVMGARYTDAKPLIYFDRGYRHLP